MVVWFSWTVDAVQGLAIEVSQLYLQCIDYIDVQSNVTSTHFPEVKLKYPRYKCNHLVHLQPCLRSSNCGMEPRHWGPIDTHARPIVTQQNVDLNIHQCDNNKLNLFGVYCEIFVWSMSHPLTWRRLELWPIVHPASRWRLRHFGLIFEEQSCRPSPYTVYTPQPKLPDNRYQLFFSVWIFPNSLWYHFVEWNPRCHFLYTLMNLTRIRFLQKGSKIIIYFAICVNLWLNEVERDRLNVQIVSYTWWTHFAAWVIPPCLSFLLFCPSYYSCFLLSIALQSFPEKQHNSHLAPAAPVLLWISVFWMFSITVPSIIIPPLRMNQSLKRLCNSAMQAVNSFVWLYSFKITNGFISHQNVLLFFCQA